MVSAQTAANANTDGGASSCERTLHPIDRPWLLLAASHGSRSYLGRLHLIFTQASLVAALPAPPFRARIIIYQQRPPQPATLELPSSIQRVSQSLFTGYLYILPFFYTRSIFHLLLLSKTAPFFHPSINQQTNKPTTMHSRLVTVAALFASGSLAAQNWLRLDAGTANAIRGLRIRQPDESFLPGTTPGYGDDCSDAFGAGHFECADSGVCYNPDEGQLCCDEGCMCNSMAPSRV